jgi:hypothetical protein
MRKLIWWTAGVKLFLFGLLYLYLEVRYGYGQELAAILGEPAWTGYSPTAMYLLLGALCIRRARIHPLPRK